MTVLREEFHPGRRPAARRKPRPLLPYVREHASTELSQDSTGDDWPLPEFVGTFASGEGDLSEKSKDAIRRGLSGVTDK